MPSPPATLPAATEPPARPRSPAAVARGPFALDWWRLAPALAATAVAIVYLIAKPRTGDLAAHVFRAELFQREGLTIWNGAWYAGHHAIAYSVLFPPLAWLVGPLPVGAASAVASAGLFERIVHRQWGRRARWGALWFGLAPASLLFTGRLPFALGVTFGLAAVLALQRRRNGLGYALALGCSITSPVAGLFLAMAGLIDVVTGERRRGALLAAASFAPALLLAVAFPEGGYEPFALSSFWPGAALVLVCIAFLPADERRLRIGAAVYAAAATAAYLFTTPMGGNAARFGSLFAGPLLACVLAGRSPTGRLRVAVLGLLFAALAVLQWSSAFRDTGNALDDPSTSSSYYQPLLTQLNRRVKQPTRIEIPFTRSHWESAEIAPRYALARGWERQLDISRNGLFYTGVLDRVTYGTWLAEHGVGWVAVAGATPDYAGYGERALIESGLPYLKLRWRSKDWRLYQVTLPHPLVVPEGRAWMRLAQLGDDSLTLDVRRPGAATVKVQWSPYWRAPGACVARDGEWTRIVARRRGPLRMSIEFSPERIFDRGRRCG